MPVFVGQLFRGDKPVARCQVKCDAEGAHVQDVDPPLRGGKYELRSTGLTWRVHHAKGDWKELADNRK